MGSVDPRALLEGAERDHATRAVARRLLRRPEYEPTVLRLGVVTAIDPPTYTATVSVGGAEPIPGIPTAADYLPQVGDKVSLLQTGSQYIVISALQRDSAGRVKFHQDSMEVAAPGGQTLVLTHEPITNSEHLYWNGLYQPGSEWTRHHATTVDIADGAGLLEVGDELVMEYAWVPVNPTGALAIEDDFDRSTLAPGAYHWDGHRIPWEVTSPEWTITGGALDPDPGSSGEYCVLDTGFSDGSYSTVRVGASSFNDQDDRLAFRVSADKKKGFLWLLTGTVAYFDEDVWGTNGNGETVGNAGSIPDGVTVKVELDGPEMRFYVGGALTTTITDSRLVTETRHGYGTSDGNPGVRQWDDFRFEVASW